MLPFVKVNDSFREHSKSLMEIEVIYVPQHLRNNVWITIPARVINLSIQDAVRRLLKSSTDMKYSS